MKDRLYLAYGSNLNVEQMSRRCPYAMPVGTGMIEGYRLLFRGSKTGAYLTIEKSEGDRVPVGVWSVSPSDERALDRYEGFPTFYRKEDFTIEVTGFHGEKKKTDCFAYIMNEGRPVEEPSRGYYETCLEGYRQFKFDPKYLEEALRSKRKEKTMGNVLICPICGKEYSDHPALSRKDNKTLICPDCGTKEALDAIGISEDEKKEIIETIHEHSTNLHIVRE